MGGELPVNIGMRKKRGKKMAEVKRIFVEKKKGFDIEASHLLKDLRDNLGIRGLMEVRLLNRYDISGISDEELNLAKRMIFSEPNVDIVYDEELNLPAEYRVFAMEYLPGQYDQRADSAAQCVQLLTQGEAPKVRSAKVVALKGDISDGDVERVKDYLINPVESRLASFEKPPSLDLEVSVPEDVAVMEGFTKLDGEGVMRLWKELGLAMTAEDLAFCRDYFRDVEKRDPTITEIRVIDTYWSDHCRHTTFLTRLDSIEVEKGELAAPIEEALKAYHEARREVYGETDRAVTLMDIATMGMKLLKKQGKLSDLDLSDEINACSIEVPVEIDGKVETWLVQFKNETHNHPTEIEPFGGAATCLGGAIRDPLSGRAYVYQAMRVTGSGDPRTPIEKTLPGKLSQRKITVGAAQGYSSYGNQIGLATGQVNEIYDEGYVAKRMEIGAVIGACPKENVKREKPAPGDVIVLLGGRTGRDGCGGATGSSKAHTQESTALCGAEVQKGNPPTERKIQRLFRNPEASRLIKKCNDFGAGGVCVAIGELAPGLEIELDKVPKKYEGLDGTELAISESQERMAVVLDACDVEKFIELANRENLEATPVARVSETPRLVMRWRGKKIVDITRAFLDTNGVQQRARAIISAVDPAGNYRERVPREIEGKEIDRAFKDNLARLNVAAQKGLVEMFDSTIGAGTVLMPFGGAHQLTPEEAMVAKIPSLKGETDTATAMSFGFMPGLSRWSPFHGAAYAVVESLSKIAAVGAPALKARLTFQEYFERMYGEPRRFGKPAAALLGAFLAQKKLGVPSIGGKDSMSGSFEDMDVPPTLVSFAVALTKASKTVSAAFKRAGSKVCFVPVPVDKATALPDWEKLRALYEKIFELADSGEILAACVVKEGGAAAAVAKMAFGNKIGFEFEVSDGRLLFAPLCGSFVLELKGDGDLAEFGAVALGRTIAEPYIVIESKKMPIGELIEVWRGTLNNIFPDAADAVPKMEPKIVPFGERLIKAPAIKAAKPRVFIPVFPGTNCEVDTARAFERAGAKAEILVVNNLTPAAIEETVRKMAELIDKSQIVMIPGGFSGGDEPDGSGKFIATTFRNPYVKEAVTRLLEERDGLMLGICNGFQALIKLGLVPYGKVCEIGEDDPTLTFNTIGRHISRMVRTKVVSVKSPWLAKCELGDIHAIAISHGEGRFVANEETLMKLNEKGQVAFQYVDLEGKATGDPLYNPNGSVCAIEGITSPDGRVLGKMGHSERIGNGVCINVPGEKDQHLFEAGVEYFR